MLVSVKDACTLQDNTLNVRVADQIEQLEKLIRPEGHGEAYSDKTHITRNMCIQQARSTFDFRYESRVKPAALRWAWCARVLSRQDIVVKMWEAW